MYQVKEEKSLFGVKGTVSGSDIATAYIAPTETKERGCIRIREVQKSGSPVITIIIPYYQALMHLTELLNSRTPGLLQF